MTLSLSKFTLWGTGNQDFNIKIVKVYKSTITRNSLFFKITDVWSYSSRFVTMRRQDNAVQFSHSVVSYFLWPCGLQHARFPCLSPTARACSNSCADSQCCYPTISSSVIPFSCLQFFPASGSFQMSQFFASGGQSIGPSASASVLPMNIQDWFLLGLIGLISLQSKELSRVFCNTTVQKHQFYSAQLSLWSNSSIHTWLLEKP